MVSVDVNFFAGPIDRDAPLVSFGVFTGVFLPLVYLFWTRRTKEPLFTRSAPLVLFTLVNMLVIYAAHAVAIYLAYSPYPSDHSSACHLQYWIGAGFWPLCFSPYVIRGFRLYTRYTRGRIMVSDNRTATGLPNEFKHVEVHRSIERRIRFIETSRGAVGFTVAYYGASMVMMLALYLTPGVYDLSDPTGFWCNSPVHAWATLAIIAAINMMGYPTVFFMALANAKDAFSTMTEFTILLFTESASSILSVLAMFSVLPVPYGILHMVSCWLSIVWTLLYPVMLSYVHEQNVRAMYGKTNGAAAAAAAAAANNESRFQSTVHFLPRMVTLFFWGHRIANVVVDTTSESSGDLGSSNAASSLLISSQLSMTSGGGGDEQMLELTSVSSSSPASPKPHRSEHAKAAKTVKHRSTHTGTTVRLSDLLKNPVESDSLIELGVHCFCVELVLFALDAIRFHDIAASRPVEEQIASAGTLVDAYIVEGAAREININDDARQEVLRTYRELRKRHEEGRFVPSDHHDTLSGLFRIAEAEVSALIKTNILPLWRPSAALTAA